MALEDYDPDWEPDTAIKAQRDVHAALLTNNAILAEIRISLSEIRGSLTSWLSTILLVLIAHVWRHW